MLDPKSPIKTTLTITLKAGDVSVAESSNPTLWQQVLAAITAEAGSKSTVSEVASLAHAVKLDASSPLVNIGNQDHAASFAKEIGVSLDKVQGAISPSHEAAYLHLDLHVWGAWVKNSPGRGPNSVSATAVAATLLVLWFRKAGLGAATIEQARAVLQTANIPSPNSVRSIRNCSWLQLKGDSQITLNPAKISDAIEVARAFCASDKPKFPE